MKKLHGILSTGVAIALSLGAQAQDIHFSQFYENSILRNPALTGIYSGDFKVGIDYRNQWSGIVTNPYQTAMATAEARILVNRNSADYLSFGLAASYDKAGTIDFTSQQIMPAIAYNKSLGDRHNSYFSLGVAGGYVSRFVDMSKMTFSSQYVNGSYSSANPTGENAPFKSMGNYDLGVGISMNSSLDEDNRANYYVGASMYHLNQPTEIFNGGYSDVKLPMKLQINAGLNLTLNETFSLALHGNYSREQPYNEWIYGGMLSWHSYTPGMSSQFSFSFGAFYRYQDAIIPTVRIDFSSVAFTFAYDATNSTLATNGGSGAGATEVSLFVKGVFNHPKNSRDGLQCPRFDNQINYPFNNR